MTLVWSNSSYRTLFATTQLLFLGLASALIWMADPPPVAHPKRQSIERIRFQMSSEPEIQPLVEPVPEPVAKPEPKPEPAPVLTPDTKLDQVIERPAPAGDVATEEVSDAPPPERRVYGVRKVFARGLSDGSRTSGSILTKRGNALGGTTDSLTATAADLGGTLAPLSTVSQAPSPLKRVKPEYSEQMREERATGTVSARLLIDTEGNVRTVEILSDFGFDSRELATRAFEQFRFLPATRDGEMVAVWIVHKIRFEFQE